MIGIAMGNVDERFGKFLVQGREQVEQVARVVQKHEGEVQENENRMRAIITGYNEKHQLNERQAQDLNARLVSATQRSDEMTEALKTALAQTTNLDERLKELTCNATNEINALRSGLDTWGAGIKKEVDDKIAGAAGQQATTTSARGHP